MGTNDKSRGRIFEMSERKVNEMKRKEQITGTAADNEKRIDVVEVTKRSAWTAPLRAAAAFAVVAALGVGAFGVLHAKEPPASDMTATPDAANITASDKAAVSDSSEKKTVSDARSDSKKDVSSKEEKAASSAVSEREKDVSGADASSNIEENPSDNTSSRDDEPVQSEPAQDTEEPIGEIDVQIGMTQSDKVLKITKNMSYKEVMELLGPPNDLMMEESVAQYIVDGEYLLLLNWDYDTDPILRDGRELLDGCPRLSEMMNDPENRTFDCYIVQYNGAAIRVTCPQYDLFDCAVIGVHTGEQAQEWRELIGRAMHDGRALRITHEDNILEIYPPLVSPESIELAP